MVRRRAKNADLSKLSGPALDAALAAARRGDLKAAEAIVARGRATSFTAAPRDVLPPEVRYGDPRPPRAPRPPAPCVYCGRDTDQMPHLGGAHVCAECQPVERSDMRTDGRRAAFAAHVLGRDDMVADDDLSGFVYYGEQRPAPDGEPWGWIDRDAVSGQIDTARALAAVPAYNTDAEPCVCCGTLRSMQWIADRLHTVCADCWPIWVAGGANAANRELADLAFAEAVGLTMAQIGDAARFSFSVFARTPDAEPGERWSYLDQSEREAIHDALVERTPQLEPDESRRAMIRLRQQRDLKAAVAARVAEPPPRFGMPGVRA